MSLALALGLLGYRSLHFPHDDRTREQVMAFLATGGDRLRLSVLERLDAVTDTPICATFEALDAAYPGSKFILTIRDKETWLESCRAYWAAWVDAYLLARPDDPFPIYIIAIHAKIYGTPTFDGEQFSRAYDDYHERVRRHFGDRPEDLLTIDIGEGWDPLCEFLGLPQPRAAFPWANRMPPSLARDVATG
jgi:sulfotransferase family protein